MHLRCAWLVMRARSRGLDRRRMLARTRTGPRGVASAKAAVEVAPTDALAIRRGLARLAPELRRLLELGYVEGMSSTEIAERGPA
jgi:DNA-directed RNA polymerase specialized sigma24 family protein